MTVRTGTGGPERPPADAPPAIEVDLGGRIRALRLARGQTLRQLAASASVTESFVFARIGYLVLVGIILLVILYLFQRAYAGPWGRTMRTRSRQTVPPQ